MQNQIMTRQDDYCPPAAPLVGGDHDLGPRQSWRARGIDDWVLWYTYGGACRIGHQGGELVSGPGEAVLIAPHTPHDYGSATNARRWAVLWVVFQPRADWLDWLAWPAIAPGLGRLALPAGPLREGLVERLGTCIALAASARAHRDLLAMNALEGALLWCREAASAQGRPGIDGRLKRAVDHACAHLERHLPLDELAEAAGLSRPQLTRLFRRHLGTSPQRFHERQRLERVRQLLDATTLPLAEIAGRTGFCSPFHCSARFRRQYGVSPRAYRAKA